MEKASSGRGAPQQNEQQAPSGSQTLLGVVLRQPKRRAKVNAERVKACAVTEQAAGNTGSQRWQRPRR